MTFSKECVELVKRFEGCKLVAYKVQPSDRYYTIGYGHYGPDVKRGDRITQEEACKLLNQDLYKSYMKVINYDTKYNFTQNEIDALTSFAYNVGTIFQLTDNGKRTKSVIAEKILEYTKSNGKELKGLINRRKAEYELFTKDMVLEKTLPTAPTIPLSEFDICIYPFVKTKQNYFVRNNKMEKISNTYNDEWKHVRVLDKYIVYENDEFIKVKSLHGNIGYISKSGLECVFSGI